MLSFISDLYGLNFFKTQNEAGLRFMFQSYINSSKSLLKRSFFPYCKALSVCPYACYFGEAGCRIIKKDLCDKQLRPPANMLSKLILILYYFSSKISQYLKSLNIPTYPKGREIHSELPSGCFIYGLSSGLKTKHTHT